MNNDIIVSVVMPVYNEEKYIDNCIESLLKQDYSKSNMEWIFVDGCSTDKTVDILNSYVERYPELIRVYNNPHKIVPYAMNIGITESRGKYIVRLDAHAEYASDYISKCVYYLENTDAENVGGIAQTKANGFMGYAIAQMLSTKFGVGDSSFRISEGNRYVDTVPFGAYRREVFDKIGLFNTKLIRSEDNDINSRIRENGGKIWLAEDICFTYYCRDSVKGILKMGLQNGNALFRTIKENPKAMSVRHFIPFVFLMSLLLLPLLCVWFEMIRWLFFIEIGCYFLLDIYYSFIKTKPIYGIINIWLYPLFHICYGLGSLLGLLRINLY